MKPKFSYAVEKLQNYAYANKRNICNDCAYTFEKYIRAVRSAKEAAHVMQKSLLS